MGNQNQGPEGPWRSIWKGSLGKLLFQNGRFRISSITLIMQSVDFLIIAAAIVGVSVTYLIAEQRQNMRMIQKQVLEGAVARVESRAQILARSLDENLQTPNWDASAFLKGLQEDQESIFIFTSTGVEIAEFPAKKGHEELSAAISSAHVQEAVSRGERGSVLTNLLTQERQLQIPDLQMPVYIKILPLKNADRIIAVGHALHSESLRVNVMAQGWKHSLQGYLSLMVGLALMALGASVAKNRLFLRGMVLVPLQRLSAAVQAAVANDESFFPTPQEAPPEVVSLTKVFQQLVATMKSNQREAQENIGKAEAVIRQKSDLIATMSHELRTPLHGIIGVSSYLSRSGNLTSDQLDCLKTIENSGERLMQLLSELLEQANLEVSKAELQLQWFSLDSLLSSCLQLFLQKRISMRLKLEYVNSQPDLWVRSDPAKIQQIIVSLIDSVIKCAENSSIRVGVDIIRDSESNGLSQVRIDVAGVNFEGPQCQASAPRHSGLDSSLAAWAKREPEGSIPQSVIKILGGALSTMRGEGITKAYRLSICCEVSQMEPADEQKPIPQRFDETLQGKSRKTKVLVVEDDPINVKIAKLMLTSLGLDVDVAFHGEQALEMISKGCYDVVLMDIQMDGMDGLEVTRRVRAWNDPKIVPYIVAVTALAREQDRGACKHAGMDAFLSKPFRVEELRSILATFEGCKASPATSETSSDPRV